MLGEMRGVVRSDELRAVRRCRSVVVHGRRHAPSLGAVCPLRSSVPL
jgi:hypothetical protein